MAVTHRQSLKALRFDVHELSTSLLVSPTEAGTALHTPKHHRLYHKNYHPYCSQGHLAAALAQEAQPLKDLLVREALNAKVEAMALKEKAAALKEKAAAASAKAAVDLATTSKAKAVAGSKDAATKAEAFPVKTAAAAAKISADSKAMTAATVRADAEVITAKAELEAANQRAAVDAAKTKKADAAANVKVMNDAEADGDLSHSNRSVRKHTAFQLLQTDSPSAKCTARSGYCKPSLREPFSKITLLVHCFKQNPRLTFLDLLDISSFATISVALASRRLKELTYEECRDGRDYRVPYPGFPGLFGTNGDRGQCGLYPHQLDSLAAMHRFENVTTVDDSVRGGILGEAAGLGKTLIMIALICNTAGVRPKVPADEFLDSAQVSSGWSALRTNSTFRPELLGALKPLRTLHEKYESEWKWRGSFDEAEGRAYQRTVTDFTTIHNTCQDHPTP